MPNNKKKLKKQLKRAYNVIEYLNYRLDETSKQLEGQRKEAYKLKIQAIKRDSIIRNLIANNILNQDL